MGWSVTPENQGATINSSGLLTLSENTGNARNFTVKYVDESTNRCGVYEFTQQGSSPGPSPTTSGTMTLTIVNDTGNALTVDSNGFFYVHEPGLPQEMHSGVYLYLSNPRANITIPSGPSTWNNVAFEGNSSDPIVGYELNNGGSESPKLYKSMSEHVNIIDAGWASSLAISGEDGILKDEGSYTLTIT